MRRGVPPGVPSRLESSTLLGPALGARPGAPLPLPAPSRERIARGTIAPAEPETDGMWRGESWAVRWRRRAITVPGLALATLLYTAALPLCLVYGLIADLLRRRPLLLCRFHLTIWSCFALHCVGLTALAVWWIVGRALRMDRDRWRAFHGGLEGWWSNKLVGIARLFYGLEVEVEGDEVVQPGPVVVLARHASIVDTMLPGAVLLGAPHRMALRIVKKRELLWDPCVDFVSTRVPRAFVRRGSGAVHRELEVIARLTDGMGPRDVVAIFPEGTRWTPEKQAQVLARLRARHPEAAERAARLRHVLPIRTAGTLALLERRPDLDVVFCAHTGLEGASKLEDFVSGSLLGRTWKIKFWRVPRAEIPLDRDARVAWLERCWEDVDAWIDAHRA